MGHSVCARAAARATQEQCIGQCIGSKPPAKSVRSRPPNSPRRPLRLEDGRARCLDLLREPRAPVVLLLAHLGHLRRDRLTRVRALLACALLLPRLARVEPRVETARLRHAHAHLRLQHAVLREPKRLTPLRGRPLVSYLRADGEEARPLTSRGGRGGRTEVRPMRSSARVGLRLGRPTRPFRRALRTRLHRSLSMACSRPRMRSRRPRALSSLARPLSFHSAAC